MVGAGLGRPAVGAGRYRVRMLLGLDLDGVICDIGPTVASRIADRFGVASHPDTWRTYDLRLLRLGLPEARFHAFLDETFADAELYRAAPVAPGASAGITALVQAGWILVGITARSEHLAPATKAWVASNRLPIEAVHHTPVGAKAELAAILGVDAMIEDNPVEADLVGEVCQSWLLDRPYNRDRQLLRARRLASWDDAVGRLCQLRLFA